MLNNSSGVNNCRATRDDLFCTLQMQMFGVVPPEVRISSAGGDVRCLQRKSLQAADVPGELRKSPVR
jgi:hypothetical protein